MADTEWLPTTQMRIIRPLLYLGFILSSTVGAVQQPVAEILDYGIYSGGNEESVADPDAPTGQVLIGRTSKLRKQTTTVPAKLKSKFGFRFVVHGKPEDGPIRLRLVYLFPEITDPATGKKATRYEAYGLITPGDREPKMLWDFTEPYELVTGKWTFQVFQGDRMILEKAFDVVRPGKE